MLWFMGSQKIGHDRVTELNCELNSHVDHLLPSPPSSAGWGWPGCGLGREAPAWSVTLLRERGPPGRGRGEGDKCLPV